MKVNNISEHFRKEVRDSAFTAARVFSISKSDSLIDQRLKHNATKLTPLVTSPSSANLAIAKSHYTKFESDSKKATSKSGDVNEQLM